MATHESRWVFEQLGGPRKKLELADHAAPHGRPRQAPVVSPEMHIRTSSTYYSGDVPRTIHVFGPSHEPVELVGRFSDRRGGRGFAIAKRDEVMRFVADQQEVLISWSDVYSVVGFITSFVPALEAVSEEFLRRGHAMIEALLRRQAKAFGDTAKATAERLRSNARQFLTIPPRGRSIMAPDALAGLLELRDAVDAVIAALSITGEGGDA